MVIAVDTATNTLSLREGLTSDHAAGIGVCTDKQGLLDIGYLLNSPPESSLVVMNTLGGDMNGGAKGSYTWYCNSIGAVMSDPMKDPDVYP